MARAARPDVSCWFEICHSFFSNPTPRSSYSKSLTERLTRSEYTTIRNETRVKRNSECDSERRDNISLCTFLCNSFGVPTDSVSRGHGDHLIRVMSIEDDGKGKSIGHRPSGRGAGSRLRVCGERLARARPSAITIYTNKETLNTLMTRFTAFLSSHCDEGNEDYDHNERRLAGLAARARRAAAAAAGAGAAPRH